MQPRPASNSRQPSFLSLPSAGISHHIWFFGFFFCDSSSSYAPTQNLPPTSRMLRLQACDKNSRSSYLHLFGFVFLLCFVWRVWLGVWVEISQQLAALLLSYPRVCSQEQNLGCRSWWQSSLSTEPYHSSSICFSFVLFFLFPLLLLLLWKFCFLVKHKALGFEAHILPTEHTPCLIVTKDDKNHSRVTDHDITE